MKKILAFVLALTVVMAMAACTPANNNETTGAAEVLPANALELLTTTCRRTKVEGYWSQVVSLLIRRSNEQ